MKIIALIKAALKKQFMTASEKEAIKKGYAALDAEEKGIIADEYKSAMTLKVKEEAPEKKEEEEDEEEEDDESAAETEKMIKTLLVKATAEVTEKTQKQVKEWLDENKELMEKSAGLYNKEVKKDRSKMNEYLRELAKSIVNGDESAALKLKELSTDSSGSPYGGYVVDSELSAEIRHLMTEYGVARREMTALQLSKGSYKANNLATDVSVYWGAEQAKMLASEIVLGQETLELVKLYAIVTLTSELIEDGEVDLFSFITGRVAEGFARAEDTAFFNGDGSASNGGFTGILQASDVNVVNMTGSAFADISPDDCLDMQDATPQAALKNGKYFGHRTIRSLLRKFKDDQGQYIYQAPAEKQPAMLWDKPFIDVEAMPSKTATAETTGFLIFGDLRLACILGYKGAMSAKRFDAGTVRNVADDDDINLITQDSEAIRITQRSGYIRILPKALTVLKTAAASA